MYYVYEIWDSTNNIPIYVGYGKGSKDGKNPRYASHLKEAIAFRDKRKSNISRLNMYKINVLLQCENISYRFPYENVSYQEACDLEKYLISYYGRRIDGSGTLTNLDSGGRGGMTRSKETCEKISKAFKGRPSPLLGRKLGTYNPQRIKAASDGIRAALCGPNGEQIRINISNAQKGKELSSDHKSAISNSLKGRPSPMRGKTPWNKGLSKDTDTRILTYSNKLSESCKGRTPHNKGLSSNNKGKTYDEIYGKELAAKLRQQRKNTAWVNNGHENKKIDLSELDEFLMTGWVRGRLMPKK